MFDTLSELGNDVSLVLLTALITVTSLLVVVYVLDLAWNFVRALLDPKRGFHYYFSEEGPEN
ncbi:MAG: hypothetical protein LCH92_21185 [Proteobacteria bacterium]|nr:hypothetical protein [Pseudomonadota bacterium]